MKLVYKLEHKRTIEIDENTGEKISTTKLLGFFSSEKKCNDIILQYLLQPGFKEFPNDFNIEQINANIDKYNDIPDDFNMTVFYLSHEYYDGSFDYISDLGYYSKKTLARKAQEKYQLEPEFAEHPDGFCVSEYKIDEGEWKEGFFVY